MDSCEALSKFLRQQMAPNPLSQAPIVKRENEADTFYSLQSLPDEGEFIKNKENNDARDYLNEWYNIQIADSIDADIELKNVNIQKHDIPHQYF